MSNTSSAKLRYVRVSPQKARLVADLVRGLDVSEAIETLSFVDKKSAPIIKKLVESAVANAEQSSEEIDIDDLFVETIYVDAGPSLRRFRPRAQGRANRILKKTSHITVRLATRASE
ncbi:MAG: 50S ribosomal protein L22 [Myxococcota bacterium]